MRTLGTIALVTCVGLAAGVALAQEQLLPNPGFEELDANGRPTGWEVAEGCKVLGPEQAQAGEHAVEVRYGSGVRYQLAVRAGDSFRLEGYTRRPPGTDALRGRVLVRWLALDGSKVSGNTDYPHHAGSEWSRFVHTFEIPPGCAKIDLVVDGPYLTEDWFWFDSLTLVKVDRLQGIDPVALEIGRLPLRAVRIADCHSFALLRLPYYMDAPCDGKVETAATMRAYRDRPNPYDHCDFDFSFYRDETVSAALIHTVASPLQRATLYAEVDGDWREVASLTNDGKTLREARDIVREGDDLVVTVHNIGAADAPAGLRVAALDADGDEVASMALPAVPAPVLCVPATVTVRLPAGGASVVLDADDALAEITEVNNRAQVPQ